MDFVSKYNQIYSLLRIWLHLLKKLSMKNFIFSPVLQVLYCRGDSEA